LRSYLVVGVQMLKPGTFARQYKLPQLMSSLGSGIEASILPTQQALG